MDKKLEIKVVVSGQPTMVEANEEAPLGTIIPRALEQTHNTSRPPSDWQLRDAAGNLLDGSRKIGSFGFAPGVELFLSLGAGVGGTWLGTVR